MLTWRPGSLDQLLLGDPPGITMTVRHGVVTLAGVIRPRSGQHQDLVRAAIRQIRDVDGVVDVTPIRHCVPVTDYLRLQARYAHLFRPTERTETIARIQAAADRNIARFGLMPDNISPERTGV
jgi:hypothetical protein